MLLKCTVRNQPVHSLNTGWSVLFGRVTALYKSCCNLKCCFLTWLHTFAALIVPHGAGPSPDIISQYSVAMLHSLKLLCSVPAVCSFSLPYLKSPHLSSHTTAGQVSCCHPSLTVELHCSKCKFTEVELTVFQDLVLMNRSLLVMLTKVKVKRNDQESAHF